MLGAVVVNVNDVNVVRVCGEMGMISQESARETDCAYEVGPCECEMIPQTHAATLQFECS